MLRRMLSSTRFRSKASLQLYFNIARVASAGCCKILQLRQPASGPWKVKLSRGYRRFNLFKTAAKSWFVRRPEVGGSISQHSQAGFPSQPTHQQANHEATRSKEAKRPRGQEVKRLQSPEAQEATGPLSAGRRDTDSNILSGAGGWERGCRALQQETPPTNTLQGSRPSAASPKICISHST